MRLRGLLVPTAIVLAGCGADGKHWSTPYDASTNSTSNDSAAEATASDVNEAGNRVGSDAPNTDGSAPGDVSTASFVDPDPLPCAGMDPSTLCLMGWTDTQHTFTGCCLTTLAREPQGKCGISAASSPCVERKAPGNPDPNCTGGDFVVCFAPGDPSLCAGGFRVGGTGAGCCQWRNGTCGVAADDLGCVEFSEKALQGTPCTPDFANGSQYP
jgi:hypothetical protein